MEGSLASGDVNRWRGSEGGGKSSPQRWRWRWRLNNGVEEEGWSVEGEGKGG